MGTEDGWIGQRGALEGVKFGAHLLLFGCVCAVGAYNAAAYATTRARAHLANALLYGGLALYEIRQLWQHATALAAQPPPTTDHEGLADRLIGQPRAAGPGWDVVVPARGVPSHPGARRAARRR